MNFMTRNTLKNLLVKGDSLRLLNDTTSLEILDFIVAVAGNKQKIVKGEIHNVYLKLNTMILNASD